MPSKTKRKAIKQGKSLSLTLPKDFLEYYEIKKGDELTVIYDGKIIIYSNEEEYEKDKERAAAFLERG
jgi:antitoxin component of MazEF toxin-antitoxin module